MGNNQKPYPALVILIILVGVALRCWDYFNIPFMFDELSAMGRTTYDSVKDVIRFGVVERDSHPAGVQLFLYYWVLAFGDAEPVVKFPFVVSGIVSIWLSYKIGEIWFGRQDGILTAAFVSSLQLFVMYSQIARPYVSGLLITLLMVYYWSKYFFFKPKIKYLVWFAIFGAMAAYNHYFSLLFAATVGLSGLFLVNRKTILPYCLSGVGILLLYLPHLGILFDQAEKGSIGGWLGAPGPYFLFEYLYWLFHKSAISIGLLLLILVIGIVTNHKRKESFPYLLKKRIIIVVWLLPAPIFGYIYSYTVEPILQYSLLIFTTPYLLMLLFSFIGNLKWKQLSIAVILVLLVNSLTLNYVRDYYRVFYKQAFKHMAKSAVKLEERHPGDIYLINDYIPYYSDYYLGDRDENPIPYFTTRNAGLDIAQFDSVVGLIEEDMVLSSGLDDQYFQVIQSHFPYWIDYDYGFTFEQYLFSKTKPDGEKVLTAEIIGFTDFSKAAPNWNFSSDHVLVDSSDGSSQYKFESKDEWGPKVRLDLDSLGFSVYEIIDVAIEILPEENLINPLLVAEIKKDEEQVMWKGFNFGVYRFTEGSWQKFYATIDLQKALNNKADMKGLSLELYLWNRNKNQFFIKEISISRRPGNPDRYGL